MSNKNKSSERKRPKREIKVKKPEQGQLGKATTAQPPLAAWNTTETIPGAPRNLLNTLNATDFNSATLDNFSNPAGTTIFLVILLHILFFHQWNVRKRRKDVLVSYRTLVVKRQYHKVWLAMLSHPPAQNLRRRRRRRGLSSPSNNSPELLGGEERIDDPSQQQQQQQQQQQDIRTRIQTAAKQIGSWAYQSGFALMLYNSHMIWSCRALEVFYNFSEFQQKDKQMMGGTTNMVFHSVHPWQYLRVLVALTAVALLIELRFSHTLLRISKRLSAATDSSPIITTGDSSSEHDASNHSRIQQKILQRPIGTATALTAALLVVFRDQFEYVPLQVLPFLDNQWILLGLSIPASVTTMFCLCILWYLSYPHHPGTSVICGILSGWMLSTGITDFVAEPWWGNSLLGLLLLLSCLSVRASSIRDRQCTERSSSHNPTWIPCIDFVAWNRRGQSIIVIGGSSPDEWERNYQSSGLNRSLLDDDSSFSDSSDDGESSDDNDSAVSGLYGRIPATFADNFDESDDNENDIEMPSLENGRSQTVRSRHGGNQSR